MLFFALFAIAYLYDPYGIIDNHGKRIENLTTQVPDILIEKTQIPSDYFLIGTSRTLRIDPIDLQKWANVKRITHLGISGSNISQWLELISHIKNNQQNKIILGLDVFSLNDHYKRASLQNERTRFHLPYYFSSNFIEDTTLTFIRNIWLTQDSFFNSLNSFQANPETFQRQNILNFVTKNQGYKNYAINQEKFQALIKSLSNKDMIIIFPQYFLYYQLFASCPSITHNIQTIYFAALKQIITQTDAQVWSFYGINSITLDPNNFDNYGWHFKPKITPLIFARIFNNKSIHVPDDFGVLLTKENFEQEFQKILQLEKQHFHP